MLNSLFSKFDDLCKEMPVYKVETIGAEMTRWLLPTLPVYPSIRQSLHETANTLALA